MAITVTTLAKPANIQVEVVDPGAGAFGAETKYYKVFSVNGSTVSLITAISPWSDEGSVVYAANDAGCIFWDLDHTDVTGYIFGRISSSGAWQTDNDTESFFYGAQSYWTTPALLGSSTVDADSASGTATLFVADTTGFTVGVNTACWIIIDKGGAKEEVIEVTSINAGVSLGLGTNLVNTHLGADAATVYRGIHDYNTGFGMKGTINPTDDGSRKKWQTAENGIAGVVVTGTNTWDDIATDVNLENLFIYKRATSSMEDLSISTGSGHYESFCNFQWGNNADTTDITIDDCSIDQFGRMIVGISGASALNTTLNLGNKASGERSNGTRLNMYCQRSDNNRFVALDATAATNIFDTTITWAEGLIYAAALDTTESTSAAGGYGSDYNPNFGGGANIERFTYRYGTKIRIANGDGFAVVTDSVTTSGTAEFELFYSGTTKLNLKGWTVEGADVPMLCGGNPQLSEDGLDMVFENFTLINSSIAEASLDSAVNVNWINPTVSNAVSGTDSNIDFTCRVDTGTWNTGVAQQRDARLWFPVSVLVVDNATDNVISGATVKIYINGATTTLANNADFTAATISLIDWDFTTDANGKITAKQLLRAKYEPAQASDTGDKVDILSNLSDNGHASYTLIETLYNPFVIVVQAAGYKSYQGTLLLEEEQKLVIGLDAPSANTVGPIIVVT